MTSAVYERTTWAQPFRPSAVTCRIQPWCGLEGRPFPFLDEKMPSESRVVSCRHRLVHHDSILHNQSLTHVVLYNVCSGILWSSDNEKEILCTHVLTILW